MRVEGSARPKCGRTIIDPVRAEQCADKNQQKQQQRLAKYIQIRGRKNRACLSNATFFSEPEKMKLSEFFSMHTRFESTSTWLMTREAMSESA
jgi:hypothetical protein